MVVTGDVALDGSGVFNTSGVVTNTASVTLGGGGDLTASALVGASSLARSIALLGTFTPTTTQKATWQPTRTLHGRLTMTETGQDVDVWAHDYVELIFVVEESDGTTADLSGASAEWHAASGQGGDAVLSDSDSDVSVSVSDPAAGEITVTIDSNTTGDLGGRRYHHELDVVDANGVRHTVAEGRLYIKRSTTPAN
jgi:hypothetical protein